MTESIEEAYFFWLSAKVLRTPAPVYQDLMKILYTTEFVWVIPMDQNRADDGLELRNDFLHETRTQNEMDWYEMPCSVLEMLIAFSYRASFQTDMEPKDWFWIMMENLRLDEHRRIDSFNQRRVEDILHSFIWRTYSSKGAGGLFPMRHPKEDQRKVEIWYQFCAYLEDQGFM